MDMTNKFSLLILNDNIVLYKVGFPKVEHLGAMTEI